MTRDMVEIIDLESDVNILISEDGKRLWVCMDTHGTVLRAKVRSVKLTDRRTEKGDG